MLSAFIQKEKITINKAKVIVVAVIGMIIMNPIQASNSTGNYIALLSATANAIFVIWMRKCNKIDSIKMVFYGFLFASIYLLPFSAYYDIDISKYDYHSQLYILCLGFLSTGLGYFLFKKALEKLEAGICSITESTLTPILAILLAILIMREKIDWQVLIGGGFLMVSCIYLFYCKIKIKLSQ